MSEQSPRSEPLKFDKIIHPTDGYIEVPAPVLATGKTRIKHIFPGEWRFVSGGSVQHDEASKRLSLDTNDFVIEEPTTLDQFETRPAVMRVLKGMGRNALDGFIIDYRYIKRHIADDRGLSEGVGSNEFMERQTQYGAMLPLAVLFAYYDSLEYKGHAETIDEMYYLAGEVDAVAQRIAAPQSRPRRALTND